MELAHNFDDFQRVFNDYSQKTDWGAAAEVYVLLAFIADNDSLQDFRDYLAEKVWEEAQAQDTMTEETQENA
jgi:hypothetical protein